MDKFEEFGTGVGYFKGGIYGEAGTGKTHTSTLFALGIKKHLKLKGRIAMFDTETGGEYVDPVVFKETKEHIVGRKARTLAEAIKFIQDCESSNVSVAIIDSISHVWDEAQKSLLKQINERLVAKGKNPKSKLEFFDRGPLVDMWSKLTDAYVNSKLHIIICGRAANMWKLEENDEGKKELNKVGTKMRTQSEMGYEPSFLAEMSREAKYVDGKQIITRHITVLKDRFMHLDGKTAENPGFDFILPHIKMLTPGAGNAVDTQKETDMKVNEEGDAEWNREKKQRAIFCEEVQGILTQKWPGSTSLEKKAKVDILEAAFGTRAWTAVENMPSDRIKKGLDSLPSLIVGYKMQEKEAK